MPDDGRDSRGGPRRSAGLAGVGNRVRWACLSLEVKSESGVGGAGGGLLRVVVAALR